jgi:nucleotide-binding universal stress UspA family protein
MLKHILVPLDGSALSEQALEQALEITCDAAKITLLSVIEVPVDYEYALVDIPLTVVTARAYNEEEFNSTYRRVHDYLTGHAKKLQAKGYDVECIVETGDPASSISDIAADHHIGAIVMTTHGRTGLSRWLFGSVTQKVISQLQCPVLVVPGKVIAKDEEPVKAKDTAPATG